MRGNISTILCKDLSIRTGNNSYMESKAEAKDILSEYLEQMLPMIEDKLKDIGRGEEVQYVFYEPFISEKLTKDRLAQLNKLDNHIILVVNWSGDFGEEKHRNYWIIAPYKKGFAWVNKLYVRDLCRMWREIGVDGITEEELLQARDEISEVISDFVSVQSTLSEIVNDGLNQSGKTFYLLKPSVSRSTITRTLNFSRSGFQ
jgi:hypothetical protein